MLFELSMPERKYLKRWSKFKSKGDGGPSYGFEKSRRSLLKPFQGFNKTSLEVINNDEGRFAYLCRKCLGNTRLKRQLGVPIVAQR